MENLESFKPVYEAFLESNLTAREFCRKLEMPESRFYYWQKRIRNEVVKSNGDFLPVSINNHGGKVVLMGNKRQQVRAGHPSVMQSSCEIVFPNGITVRLSEDMATSVLGQLLMMNR